MKFTETIPLLVSGEKIALADWAMGEYLELNEGKDLVDDGGNIYKLVQAEFNNGSWHAYQETSISDVLKIMERHIEFEEEPTNRIDFGIVLKYLKYCYNTQS